MTDETETAAAPEEWAIVELMGHRSLAGRIQEVTRFGAQMLRVDRPFDDGSWSTTFHGGVSIYQVTPCTEAVARETLRYASDPRPVAPLAHRIEAPRQAPAPAHVFDDLDDHEPF